MDNPKFKKFLEKELEKIADIVDEIYDKLEEMDDMDIYDSADVWLSGIKQLISYDDGDLVVDSTAADTIILL
jgi:predicted transglutaminase-like cysteine proteinase